MKRAFIVLLLSLLPFAAAMNVAANDYLEWLPQGLDTQVEACVHGVGDWHTAGALEAAGVPIVLQGREAYLDWSQAPAGVTSGPCQTAPGPTLVTPLYPSMTKECGNVGTVSVPWPQPEGVGFSENTDYATYHTVTFKVAPGYQFAADAVIFWEFNIAMEPCAPTMTAPPIMPTLNPAECGTPITYTIPAQPDGVGYNDEGTQVSFYALDGFVLPDGIVNPWVPGVDLSNPCPPTVEPSPTSTATVEPSPTGTATPSPSPTGTVAPEPSETATATPPATATVEPTATTPPTPGGNDNGGNNGNDGGSGNESVSGNANNTTTTTTTTATPDVDGLPDTGGDGSASDNNGSALTAKDVAFLVLIVAVPTAIGCVTLGGRKSYETITW